MVSNAFSKSINAANKSFFLCLTWRSIRCLCMNMWSAVRDPFLTPIWNSEMTLYLFTKIYQTFIKDVIEQFSTHIKVSRNKSYFTNDPLNGDNKYTANGICKMTEFWWITYMLSLMDSFFDRPISIPMGTNCAPLLVDLFPIPMQGRRDGPVFESFPRPCYEKEFLNKLIKEGKRKLARKFNLSYRYIDDLISFNNKRFKEFISDIYPQRTHNFRHHRIYLSGFLS